MIMEKFTEGASLKSPIEAIFRQQPTAPPDPAPDAADRWDPEPELEGPAAALEQDLQSLAEHGLNVHLEPASDPVEGSALPPDTLPQTPLPTALLEVVGGDRPGIVRELSSVLAAAGVNVEQLETEYTPAPMTGGALFRATVHFCLPEELTIDQIRKKVEAVAGDLMVDISDSAEKSQ